MATSLSSNISVNLAATLVKTLTPDQSATEPFSYLKNFAWPDGTGADQAHQIYHATRTLAASTGESLDLNAGGLLDIYGNILTLTRVAALAVAAAIGNTNNVLVGGAASDQFATMFDAVTDYVIVQPGGLFLLIARDAVGYLVTAATGDLLKVTNSSSGTSVTYDIVIIGS